jgi:hypothetical protein
VIQPKILGRLLTPDFFERGLPARFLFAYPPARQAKFSEATIPDKLCQKTREIFQELFGLHPLHDEYGEPCPFLLSLSPGALILYKAFYNECGETAIASGEREEAAWAKLSGYAARQALVGQLARNVAATDPALRDPEKPTAAEDTVLAACDLARWFGKEAERIYATLAESPEQREERKLVEFIFSRGGSVTVRDLMTYYRPLRNNREEAERLLNAFVRAKHGKWIETRGERGPATRKFQLLPLSASAGFSNPLA